MTITKDNGRQYPLIATALVDGTATTGNVSVIGRYPAIDLPSNSVVTGGGLGITTIFTATTDIDVGDAADADEYSPTIFEGDSLGWNALTPTGIIYTAAAVIEVSVVVADTIVGVAQLYVEYLITNRANEVGAD